MVVYGIDYEEVYQGKHTIRPHLVDGKRVEYATREEAHEEAMRLTQALPPASPVGTFNGFITVAIVPEKARTKPVWIRLGTCTVDAGMLAIGDPCYVAHDSHPDHPFHDWSRFCDMLGNESHIQLNHKRGHAGLGVVAIVGDDGEFSVDGRVNKRGTIQEIRIKRISN